MKVLATLKGGAPVGISPYKLEPQAACGFCHAAYDLYAEQSEIQSLFPVDLSKWSAAAQQTIVDQLQQHHSDLQKHGTAFVANVEWPGVPSGLNSLGDKRKLLRFPMRQSVRLKAGATEIEAVSQDVSPRGIFFYTDVPLPSGSTVELHYVTPEQDVFTPNLQLRCTGKVLRVEEVQPGNFGIAVEVDNVEMAAAAAC